MKCFALFLVVVVAAAAMAEETAKIGSVTVDEPKPQAAAAPTFEKIKRDAGNPETAKVGSVTSDERKPGVAATPTSEEAKRDKRSHVAYAYAAPSYYAAGYHPYYPQYRTPYAYYQNYPEYGYASHYYTY